MSTHGGPSDPADSARPEVRIGDREREQAVAHLGRAFGEGRLELVEYDQRVASAYSARTASDLLLLTADLPLAPQQSSAASAEPVELTRLRNRYRARTDGAPTGAGGMRGVWATYASVITLSVVIWLIISLTGQDGWAYPWPLWVAGPWGALLLFQTFGAAAARRNSDNSQD
ncbi:MAG: DUF1707 domain-containing protein [Geodermatophilaceae bacterium]|nr:DUF1707 domain-containing protein [Geodermatophilaceae bacterium]